MTGTSGNPESSGSVAEKVRMPRPFEVRLAGSNPAKLEILRQQAKLARDGRSERLRQAGIRFRYSPIIEGGQ